jgi:hypothetical protein
MNDAVTGWTFRFLISVMPVGVLFATALAGNPVLDAFGEGYSILLYLVVTLSAEVAIYYWFLTDAPAAGDETKNIFMLILIVLLWAAFVFARVYAAVLPNQESYFLVLLAFVASAIPSFFVVRTHRDVMTTSRLPSVMNQRRDEEVTELNKEKPTSGRIGDDNVNV